MVIKKLHEIMAENKLIQKDGTIDMGTKGSYNVLTERKVLEALRPAFVEKGLVIIPHSVQSIEKVGSTTTLAMNYRIYDESDNDFIECASVGQGTSTGDKGAGSAFTYNLKYLIMKITLMMSGDDPDQIGDNVHSDEAAKNEALAVKLAQEVSSLMSGEMITPEIGAGMITYLEDHKNDPAILKDAEKQLNDMKAGAQNG